MNKTLVTIKADSADGDFNMDNISLDTINDINRKLSQAQSLALMIQGDQESNQPCTTKHPSNALWLIQDLISDTKELVKKGIRK